MWEREGVNMMGGERGVDRMMGRGGDEMFG